MLLGQLHHFVGGRVARNDQHGVVRRVVGLVELLHIVEIRRFELGQVAVEVVRVVPVGVRLLRQPEPLERAVGLIEHVDANLFADHVLLVLQRLRRDLQRPHAVRLEPHRQLERVGRHHLEVVGVIEPRRSVQRAAVLVDDADVLELGDVLGSLKHQVLEQVREAGAAFRLDAEADAVHQLDHHDRRRVVFADHHPQAVRQLLVDDRNRERLCRTPTARPARARRGTAASAEMRMIRDFTMRSDAKT